MALFGKHTTVRSLGIRRNHPIMPAVGRIEHRQRHRISVRWQDREAKVCQIIFGRGAIFVTFPYHPDSAGILARIVVPAIPVGQDVKVDMGPVGFKTQHKVKYSHYVTGDCHFSQAGRIYTKVRNVSYGLADSQRHLFTVYAQGLEHFAGPRPTDAANCFDLGASPLPPVVRIVGRWYKHKLPPKVANPITFEMTNPDYRGPAMACPPAIGSELAGYLILLEAFAQPLLNLDADFNLVFQGGFGPEAHDPSQVSSSLVLSYPGDVSQLPAIDFRPDVGPPQTSP